MRNIINLIRNENMKLSHSISTWIMIGILVIITVAFGLVVRGGGNDAPKSDWKADITIQNKEIKKELTNPEVSKRQKDKLEKNLQTNEYRLKHDIQPIQSNSLCGFVEGSSMLIFLISLFAIVMGGGIVANEFSGGTIKLLLIRPSKRWKILTSKYISVLEYTFFMLLILLVVSFLVGGTLFSFKGADSPFLANVSGKITEVNMITHILVAYGLECINLLMMVTLAFMISTVFRSSSMAIGIGVFLLTTAPLITQQLCSKFNWAKYVLFANTNLDQYITKQPLVEGMTMTFSITVLIAYFIIFNGIAYAVFTKRDIVA
ncbi:ABC transporter permease (plasmid) [Clostridium estertheticum]|uniref:ABC transporter permease n=1 Tax=Clostridium estertheticum TaxID=238834 RepID=UPI001C0AA48A|nr:ABC transporter permease [Clostridium estertheticum]MBU3217179.1 ABC transporter permease [Clostridium estertheticum]WAG58108.1 ABC transporter permease [Clostridium estertheticum]